MSLPHDRIGLDRKASRRDRFGDVGTTPAQFAGIIGFAQEEPSGSQASDWYAMARGAPRRDQRRLPLSRTSTQLAGPLLARREFCFGSSAGRSGSPQPQSPGARLRKPTERTLDSGTRDDGSVTSTRLITADDVDELVELLRRNREFLAPWEPAREPEFFTLDRRREAIQRLLRELEQGVTVPCVIVADNRLVGRVTLSNVVRGPFQSCNIGYWVSADANGHGHAPRSRRWRGWRSGSSGCTASRPDLCCTTPARNACSSATALSASASPART
jgi:RimJ/RimL family protein N-acetyltransferase